MVILYLHERIGAMVKIETHSNLKPLLEYKMDVLDKRSESPPELRVSLVWNSRGNITSVKPNGERMVRGTLSCLSTCFPLPPGADFMPSYDMVLKIKSKSLLARVTR